MSFDMRKWQVCIQLGNVTAENFQMFLQAIQDAIRNMQCPRCCTEFKEVKYFRDHCAQNKRCGDVQPWLNQVFPRKVGRPATSTLDKRQQGAKRVEVHRAVASQARVFKSQLESG